MSLEADIKAYNHWLPQLLQHYFGKFVVFHDGQWVGTFNDFNSAGEFALEKYDDDKLFLIRRVGEPDVVKLR